MGYLARRRPRVGTGSLCRVPAGSYSMDAMAGDELEVPEVVSFALALIKGLIKGLISFFAVSR